MENFQQQKEPLSSRKVWNLLFLHIAGMLAIVFGSVVLAFGGTMISEKTILIALVVFNILIFILSLRFLNKQSGGKGFLAILCSLGLAGYILLQAI